MSIKLDLNDGLETIELDEERKFKFNPNDVSIISKSMKFADEIDKKMKEYAEGVELATKNEDGSTKEVDDIDFNKMCELDEETCKFIFEKVDWVFGNNVSKVIFNGVSPLSITNDGEYYVVALFEKLMPIVADRMQTATEKAFANASKYTNKYIKG